MIELDSKEQSSNTNQRTEIQPQKTIQTPSVMEIDEEPPF